MSTVLLIEAALPAGRVRPSAALFTARRVMRIAVGFLQRNGVKKQKTCRFHRPEKLSVRRGAFPRDGKHAALPGGLDEASGREKPQKNYGCPAGRWMHRPSAAAQASIKASE